MLVEQLDVIPISLLPPAPSSLLLASLPPFLVSSDVVHPLQLLVTARACDWMLQPVLLAGFRQSHSVFHLNTSWTWNRFRGHGHIAY